MATTFILFIFLLLFATASTSKSVQANNKPQLPGGSWSSSSRNTRVVKVEGDSSAGCSSLWLLKAKLRALHGGWCTAQTRFVEGDFFVNHNGCFKMIEQDDSARDGILDCDNLSSSIALWPDSACREREMAWIKVLKEEIAKSQQLREELAKRNAELAVLLAVVESELSKAMKDAKSLQKEIAPSQKLRGELAKRNAELAKATNGFTKGSNS
mmetsp:Transcript_56372/g.112908  ORF Transcript_56372/g.112908 Transcript_56372/m.112908 type:complete len:212 (+) Transcript_56372:85-720(+)